jgi:hypothetical protein
LKWDDDELGRVSIFVGYPGFNFYKMPKKLKGCRNIHEK